MIRVGLTGNIGTGKSTVAKIFEILGVPVYHADLEAKKMLDKKSVKASLIAEFGDGIIEMERVNRKKLADEVFRNKKKLEILNSIIHPLVKNDLEDWFQRMRNHAYAVQEAAILFESGFYTSFNKNILVVADRELANKRVMERDGVSLEEVEQRRSNQWDQEKKIGLADFIVYNNETEMVLPQVLKIHKNLLKQ